jgi:hypothetical protein
MLTDAAALSPTSITTPSPDPGRDRAWSWLVGLIRLMWLVRGY